MTYKMVLEGGPLDGEEQLVNQLATDPGTVLWLSVPNYQSFHEDGETVIGLGCQAEYALVGQGPPPSVGDTWDTSWVYDYVSESFVAPIPPFIEPPPSAQLPDVFVGLVSESFLTILDTGVDVEPGVQLVGESSLDVDADVTTPPPPITVDMEAVTVVTVDADVTTWTIPLTGETTLVADLELTYHNYLDPQAASLEDGTTRGWEPTGNCTIANNNTVPAADGTHSLALTAVAAGDTYPILDPAYWLPVTAGTAYDIHGSFRAATQGRTCFWWWHWLDATGAVVSQDGAHTTQTDVTTGWVTVVELAQVAPPGAAQLALIPYVQACAAGEVHYVDNMTFNPS